MRTLVDPFAAFLHDATTRLSYLLRALRLAWAAARGWTLGSVALLVLQGLLPAATVYLTKYLVDRLTEAVGAGLAWESIQPVLVPAALMLFILLLTQLSQALSAWVRTAQAERIEDHLKDLIHRKALAADLAFYESPTYFDRLARANREAGARTLSLLENIGRLFQHGITLCAIAVLLAVYSLWIPLVLVLSILPAFWVVLRHHRLHHAWWTRTTADLRWAEYFDFVLTHAFPAPEVRLFDLGPAFRRAYKATRLKLRTEKIRLMRDQALAQLGAGLTALLVTVGALAWMGRRVLQQAATLGDLALFYQAFNQGQSLLRGLLNSVGQLYADALFLEHLFTFLDLKPQVTSPSHPKPVPPAFRHGISFCDVTFRYPGSTSAALQRFNLFIPAGKTVALVGPNGAGKSTLMKLLCRFYDPDEGRIELDGLDLRALKVEELRQHMAVMFQTPMRYVATAAENITISRDEHDLELARAAARSSGAHDFIDALPEGYQTLIGKQFEGGVELSGGQWQRLALARAFYREAPLVVLDEPTSAMDSWAEIQWLNRFLELVRDRTALIITHRFTTARRADLIYVMDHGRIIESGTHDELLALNGRYADSWNAQTSSMQPADLLRGATA